jgi:hypothetical protein
MKLFKMYSSPGYALLGRDVDVPKSVPAVPVGLVIHGVLALILPA